MTTGTTYNHPLDLEPGFEPRVTGYTSELPHAMTHVKVRARVGVASYTLTAGKQGATAQTLTSGVASDPIALAVGANVIEVKSATTEQGATVRTTTITVTRHREDVPGAPRNLTVTAGRGELAVAWTASLSNPTGYHVHYTSATRIDVPDGTAASGNDPATGWVVVSRSGKVPTQTITGLVNGRSYRVRVRAVNAIGPGFWEEARGTPDAAAAVPDVRLSASPNPVAEGSSVTVTATLSGALSSAVTIPLTITDNSAEPADHGTLASIAIASGATSGTGTIRTNHDADDVDETFTVELGTLPSRVVAGNPSSVRITIRDDDRVDNTQDPPPPPPEDPPPRPPGGGGGGGSGPGDDPDDQGDDDPGDDDPGGSGSSGGNGANRAPETAADIADPMLRAGEDVEIDLSVAFDDPDGDALTYEAESSDESVAIVAVDGDTLTVRGIRRGTAEITVTAEDAGGRTARQTFAVTVTASETAWYLPPASDTLRQGFVRVLNHSDAAGEVSIAATDDAGVAYEPLTLALGPRAATHFHTGDLESGNPARGLTGATGPGTGGWRLAIESETLDVEALAYVRTDDGFLAGLNDVAPQEDGALAIPIFNPGSNVDQVSLLRLVNPGDEEAEATVTGTDDAGLSPGSPVVLTLPAGTACMVDAAQLESGTGLACGAPQDGLGDGAGKWRLAVESDKPLVAMSLLSSPGGHLSNLSGKASEDWEGLWHVHLFPAASDPLGRQGVVRVVNSRGYRGTVTILAYDDADTRYDALRLSLGAGQTVHFDSDDLELGNRAQGLTGSTGSGTGTWRLTMYGVGEAHAYVRTADGFLAAMNATAPRAGAVHRVAFFNPGSNRRTSVLRLVNHSRSEAEALIDGTDDLGLRPGTTVRVLVPATDALELTAAELESGEHDAIASGALGDGTGKWRLRVESGRLAAVMSLLSSPSGHLTNLSRADAVRGLGDLRAALLPAPATVTLASAGDGGIRARWSAVDGARYDVDLLRDGVRDELRSRERAQRTSFLWTSIRAGTYTIRARSVNADGAPGPWSAVSNGITID